MTPTSYNVSLGIGVAMTSLGAYLASGPATSLLLTGALIIGLTVLGAYLSRR